MSESVFVTVTVPVTDYIAVSNGSGKGDLSRLCRSCPNSRLMTISRSCGIPFGERMKKRWYSVINAKRTITS